MYWGERNQTAKDIDILSGSHDILQLLTIGIMYSYNSEIQNVESISGLVSLLLWTCVIKIWRYALADFDQAMELLDSIEWTSTLSHDVDAYWSNWKTSFLQIMEMSIPNAIVKLKRNFPWMNREISLAIKKRNSL